MAIFVSLSLTELLYLRKPEPTLDIPISMYSEKARVKVSITGVDIKAHSVYSRDDVASIVAYSRPWMLKEPTLENITRLLALKINRYAHKVNPYTTGITVVVEKLDADNDVVYSVRVDVTNDELMVEEPPIKEA